MTTYRSTDWAAQARADLQAAIRDAVRQLLETKHLYQAITIDVIAARQRIANASISEGNSTIFEQEIKRSIEADWEPLEPALPGVATQQKTVREKIYIAFSTIKTFCGRCNRAEPHNLVYVRDITSDLVARSGANYRGPSQNFVTSYLCQACKATFQYFYGQERRLKAVAGRQKSNGARGCA